MAQPRPRGTSLTEPRRLDPRMRIVWRVQLAFTALVVVAAAGAAAAVGALPVAVPAVVAAAAGAFVWWLPAARYDHWSFALEASTLELRYGIFWRSEASVPYFRVQHVEIEQGPIQRRLGLAELRLKTAASSGSASLPGVELRDAEELRRTILDRAGGDDAV